MRNKRFIFSIKNDTSEFLLNESKRLKLSRAKLVQNILTDYKSQKVQGSTFNTISTFDQKIPDVPSLQELENTPIEKLFYDYDVYHLLSYCADLIKVNKSNEKLIYTYAQLQAFVGYYKDAITLLQEIKNETITKNLLLARIFYSMGDAQSANRYLIISQVLLNVSTSTKDEDELFIVTSCECSWLCNGPFECLQKVTTFWENSKSYSTKTKGRLNLIKAVGCMDLNNFNEAEKLLQVSITLLSQAQDFEYLCRAYSYFGFLYRDKGEMELALKYIEHARALAFDYGNTMDHLVIQSHLANIYLVMGNIDLSERLMQENLSISKRIGSVKEEYFARYILMVAYIQKNDLKSSREIIDPWYSNDTWKQYRYCTDTWKGYLDSFDNYKKGINEIHKSKEEAYAHEKRHVFISEYLEGCRDISLPETKKKGVAILQKLLDENEVSKCMKNSIQHFFLRMKNIYVV
jgi:tetratricopeptide (TPR) repeat protein